MVGRPGAIRPLAGALAGVVPAVLSLPSVDAHDGIFLHHGLLLVIGVSNVAAVALFARKTEPGLRDANA